VVFFAILRLNYPRFAFLTDRWERASNLEGLSFRLHISTCENFGRGLYARYRDHSCNFFALLRKVTRVWGTVILRLENLLGISILLPVQFPTILSKNQEDWGCNSKVKVETNFDRSFTQNHTFTGTLGRPKDVYLAYCWDFSCRRVFVFDFWGLSVQVFILFFCV
jgi:hypothetical protein